MSPTTLLLMPSPATSPVVRLSLDAAGGILSRETLAADAPADSGRRPCVLAVPAADLGLHRLRLRARSTAQAVAAAARLVEARLAVPHASLHVAVSEPGGEDDRWVAVVDPARMREWLDRAARLGFLPSAVVPDCLLLPPPEAGSWRVCPSEATWRMRGESIAFSAEPALAQAILDARAVPAEALDRATEADLARGAVQGAATIDLLQQGFSRHPAAPTGWAAWRTVRRLAIVVLALLPLGLAAQALRHELAVRSLHADAAARLEALADIPANGGTPYARANAALAAARARDAFAITTGALFEALAEVPGAGVSSLQHGEDGLLAVSLDHDHAGDVAQLTSRLAELGVVATPDSTQPSGGRLRSVLLLGLSP